MEKMITQPISAPKEDLVEFACPHPDCATPTEVEWTMLTRIWENNPSGEWVCPKCNKAYTLPAPRKEPPSTPPRRRRFAIFAALLILALGIFASPKLLKGGPVTLNLLALLGNANAQFDLGMTIYAAGHGVDLKEVVKWYHKAADQNHAKAQVNLGVMYDNGIGVEEDNKEAVKWYRKAAEQNVAFAQYNLGLMYGNGEGVEKDEKEAVKWYRKAAEQNVAKAQYNLGYMYHNGEGVEKDDKKALKWYRKAANQGFAKAQVNLAISYAKGYGVLEDLVTALAWANIAAAHGTAQAKETRAQIASYMTFDQRAKAVALSKELRKGIKAHPKAKKK